MTKRADSDEHYVLDLCDEILGSAGLRQARFEWLRGDPSEARPQGAMLPVDGFWRERGIVVEFHEEQHTKPSPFFDRRQTVSGTDRGEQRRIYDERKAATIPVHGLRLVTIDKSAFHIRSKRIVREHVRDFAIVQEYLREHGDAATPGGIVESIPSTSVSGEPIGGADPSPEELSEVEAEREGLKEFVSKLTPTEVKEGDWFAKLLTFALDSYVKKVNWEYFQEKYQGVPPDVIVDQRIKMAARYAMIEGFLSASAYTGAVAATIGSLGGASPLTVPAIVATVMVDIAYLSQLQIRLAYDIAVLYQVPLDTEDPEDLWKLIRVAFTIKGGELAREGAIKAVPAVMRPLIKRYFSGHVLATAKALPVVGKFLLQRNMIKIGIPLVGIPIAVTLNRWSTFVAGKHARSVFRNEARVVEVAERLLDRTEHLSLTLWVAWLVIDSDGKISDDEALLMRHLIRLARDRHEHIDERLAKAVNIDVEEIWSRIESEVGDLDDIVAAAEEIARIDGEMNAKERTILDEIRARCART